MQNSFINDVDVMLLCPSQNRSLDTIPILPKMHTSLISCSSNNSKLSLRQFNLLNVMYIVKFGRKLNTITQETYLLPYRVHNEKYDYR